MVSTFHAAHPTLTHMLSSVSVIHSQQIGDERARPSRTSTHFQYATNTIDAYVTQQRTLVRLCKTFDIDLATPLGEKDLTFLTAAYADSHKFTTVPLFLSAVAQFVRERWGTHYRLPRSQSFTAALTGMRHYYGPSTVSSPMAALTLADLRAIVSVLGTGDYESARDRCAFTFAFFALLRISEYASGGLRHRHVKPISGGIDITILSSKTMQHSATISIAARPDDPLCPVAAYHTLDSAARTRGLPQGSDTPLFLTSLEDTPQRLEPTRAEEFTRRLRFYISAALRGIDPARYAGHSFRRGGATAMLLAGVQASVIQRHGRWQSDIWRQYIDAHDNPAVRLPATRTLPRQTALSAARGDIQEHVFCFFLFLALPSPQTSPLAPYPPH